MGKLVSWMTPTLGRPELHEQLYEDFCADAWPDKELVVLDESRESSRFFGRCTDARVRYVHAPGAPRIEGVTRIGAARNRMLALARGEILAHRDDDDHYGPDYLATMIDRLGGAALCKLDVWRCLHEATGVVFEWDTRTTGGKHFALQGAQAREVDIDPAELGPSLGPGLLEAFRLGFGWSYVYPRRTAERYPFPEEGTEDIPWAQMLRDAGERIVFVSDAPHLALHTVHVDPGHPLGGSAHYPQRKLGAAGAGPDLYGAVRRRMIGAMGGLLELPSGQAIALEPGRRYSILASVRRKHSLRSILVRAGAWGAEVESARDEVPPEEFGAGAAERKDYRLVHIVGVSRRPVTMPWATPKFMKVLGEESAVVKAWVEPPRGAAAVGAAGLGPDDPPVLDVGHELLDPAKGDIAVIPGRAYVGTALVKDCHAGSLIEQILSSYGVVLEHLVEKAADRVGYRFVSFRGRTTEHAGGMLPWRLPRPLSWIDDTHLISCSVSTPVGSGRAETFQGLPEGYRIVRVASFLSELPKGMTPRPRVGMGHAWDSAGGEVVVQSRETGRMAIARAGRVRRAGAGDAGAALLATPQAQSAWGEVQAQLQSENATAFDIAAAQGTFSSALQQLASQGLQSSLGDEGIVTAAKQYVLLGATTWGAVQNVAGLIAHANSVPPAALMTAFTGTLVGAAAALGAISAGVGAAIVGAVGALLQLLQSAGLFGSAPQGTQVCAGFYCQGAAFTVVTQGPSGAVGCCCVFQAQDAPVTIAPGSVAWRNFPDPGQAEDAFWLTPGGSGTTTWKGAIFSVPAPWSGQAQAARPIDWAFPQYRTLESNNLFRASAFRQAFFSAWKMNAAYALNGLKAQDDAQVLLHTLRLWNRAHEDTNTTRIIAATGPLVGAFDTMSASDTNYLTVLVSAAVALVGNDPLLVDGQGNLILNLGPVKAPPSPCGADQMLNPSWLVEQALGGTPNVAKCIPAPWAKSKPLSAPAKVAIGVATVAGVGAAGAVGVALAQSLPWDHYLVVGWQGASAGAARAWSALSGALPGAREARRNPLRRGSSKKVFDSNLRRLLREGYPRDRALAIAYRQQRESAKRRRR